MSKQTAVRAVAAVGVAAAAGLVLAAPAYAEPPFALDDRVVDRSSEQVAAADLEDLAAAADEVVAETDYDLWTVYVDSFDGMRAVDWANETAIATNANTDVLLLAIAVEDREVALSVAQEAPLSDADISDIEAAARSEVGSGDWTGASLAAAGAIIEVTTGSAAPTTEPDDEPSGGSNGLGWVLGGVAVLAVGGGVVAMARRSGRSPGSHHSRAGRRRPSSDGPR